MWTEEARLEHYCRMGLMAVMVLHWLVLALLVRNSSSPVDASGTADVGSTLASIIGHLFLRG